MSTTAPDALGAVVLSFGRENRHVALVRSLIEEHRLSERAVLVVHNGYDRHDRWTPSPVPGVRTLLTGDNLGYAGGMNVGIARHVVEGRRWILCLTHEARPQPGCVARLHAEASARRRVGVVGPVLRAVPEGAPWSTGVMSIPGGMRHRLTLPDDDRFVPCDSVDGSAMLVSAEAYATIGPFDERMFMYWEETEFCQRARQHGWTVAVVGSATATATPGGQQRVAAHAYLTARNGLLYARQSRRFGAVTVRLVRSLFEIYDGVPKPGGRRSRDRRAWQTSATRTTAAAWGLIDYRRRRWGPPPAALLRRSDIRAADRG